MAYDKNTRYEVLCEDRQMQCFLRYFLQVHGANHRRIFFHRMAMGEGCGEERVRQEYPRLVQILRARRGQNVIGLVCIDADICTLQKRVQQLQEACKQQGVTTSEQEKIIKFIPKRNIETWINWYDGVDGVDEETIYPHNRGEESTCKPAAEKMAWDFKNGQVTEDVLPSICFAYNEYCRCL